MRRMFLIAATLGLCAFALMGCRHKPAFDAGEALSAEELETLRTSLESANENDNESTNSPDDAFVENKTVVYYTASGEVYHSRRECSYLKKSTSVSEGSVEQAEKSGKTRLCGACAKSEESSVTSEGNGENADAQLPDPDDGNGENKTVIYYTESGVTYHFDRNCTYLKNSNLVNEGTVDAALAAGKDRPCSRCGD